MTRELVVHLAAILVCFTSAAYPQTAASSDLARAVQPFVDRGEMIGAVMLVASKDAVLEVDAVGLSDLESKRPMTADAIFGTASMTKAITGTALMLLVDEGKVNVDDPVEKYLPEFRCMTVLDDPVKMDRSKAHPAQNKLLVRHVLTHTSGIPPLTPLEWKVRSLAPQQGNLPIDVRVAGYSMTPLEFEPGTKFKYGPVGMATAARIIEVVSGMPYEEFLKKRLFEPLGMKDTRFGRDANQSERYASGYQKDPKTKEWVKKTIPDPSRTWYPDPAGGIRSTAADLGRFCRMVLNKGTLDGKRYLKESTVNMMLTKQTADTIKEKYGFGWWEDEAPLQRNSHGGSYGTMMTIDHRHGLVMIFLTDQTDRPEEALRAFEDAAIRLYTDRY